MGTKNDVAGTIYKYFPELEEKFGDHFGASKDRRSTLVDVIHVHLKFSILGPALFLFYLSRVAFFSRCRALEQFAASGLLVRRRSTCIVHRPYAGRCSRQVPTFVQHPSREGNNGAAEIRWKGYISPRCCPSLAVCALSSVRFDSRHGIWSTFSTSKRQVRFDPKFVQLWPVPQTQESV
jgi:hypothetical protein